MCSDEPRELWEASRRVQIAAVSPYYRSVPINTNMSNEQSSEFFCFSHEHEKKWQLFGFLSTKPVNLRRLHSKSNGSEEEKIQ